MYNIKGITQPGISVTLKIDILGQTREFNVTQIRPVKDGERIKDETKRKKIKINLSNYLSGFFGNIYDLFGRFLCILDTIDSAFSFVMSPRSWGVSMVSVTS